MTCLSICSFQRPYCPLQSQEICSSCIEICPIDAIITKSDGTKEIIQDKCVKCDECRKVCPVPTVTRPHCHSKIFEIMEGFLLIKVEYLFFNKEKKTHFI